MPLSPVYGVVWSAFPEINLSGIPSGKATHVFSPLESLSRVLCLHSEHMEYLCIFLGTKASENRERALKTSALSVESLMFLFIVYLHPDFLAFIISLFKALDTHDSKFSAWCKNEFVFAFLLLIFKSSP